MNAKRLFSAGFAFLLLVLLLASAPAAPRRAFAAGEAQVVRDKFAYLPMIQRSVQQAIVVDHRHTDITKIPDNWLTEAKKLMVHYAHTSHGGQVLSGLQWLEGRNSKYNVDILVSDALAYPTDTTALRFYDGNNQDDTYITPDEYWDSDYGVNRTRSVVSPGQFNYSLWTWCGQMSESSTDVNGYLSVLTQLERDYPGTRFIYFTGHTDGSAPGSELWSNNNQVRNYVNANAKILFDFADIESYDPSGTFYPTATDSCPWCNTWCTNHPTECSSLPSDCAHSHGLQCKLKGQAFWWLMARLAGWPGPTE